MNYAVIVSGGIGSRMKNVTLPKQYVDVEGKPIILYSVEKFFACEEINAIVIVAAQSWHTQLHEWISHIPSEKPCLFAEAGGSRQASVFEGLKTCVKMGCEQGDRVLIHDAVRPLVSVRLIRECLGYSDEYNGAMPALHVTDTIYTGEDGRSITGLLDRDSLFGGQSPECFDLSEYFRIHCGLTEEQLAAVHGSSEIAFGNGMKIKLIEGDPLNFKITTIEDLHRFELIVKGGIE